MFGMQHLPVGEPLPRGRHVPGLVEIDVPWPVKPGANAAKRDEEDQHADDRQGERARREASARARSAAESTATVMGGMAS